ncbi:MAG: cytochrome c oxidase subunit II transmembrane domain-containing protein [Betaproteobacteria bacterium]
MNLHNRYMMVLCVLFTVVFAIMITSLIRHRRSCLRSSEKFSGTRGAVQWFWALLPLIILAGINFALILPAPEQLAIPPQEIKLAAASGTPDVLSMSAAKRLEENRSDVLARR